MKKPLVNFLSVLALLIAANFAPPAHAGGTCNNAPVAQQDTVQVGYGAFHIFAPLANDSDIDGDALSISSLANPTGPCSGVIEQIGSGLVRYSPSGMPLPGEATSCTVSYQVSDGTTNVSANIILLFPIDEIFSDDFESGDLSAWDEVIN